MPKTIIAKAEEQIKKGILPEKKKPKRKKVKYKKISFKVTAFQHEALVTYCKRHKTTPVRYFKSIANKQAAKYRSEMPRLDYVSENQLELFETEKPRAKKPKRKVS